MPQYVPHTNGSGFQAFYIDLPNDFLSKSNQNIEGGIRPPLLDTVGVSDDEPLVVNVSIQWDIMLWKFQYKLNTTDPDNPWPRLSEPIICPHAESRFWMSVHHDDTNNSFVIEQIIILEGNRTGAFLWDQFCLQPGTLASKYHDQPNCTGSWMAQTGKEVAWSSKSNESSTPITFDGVVDANFIVFKPAPCFRRVTWLPLRPEIGVTPEVYWLETLQGTIWKQYVFTCYACTPE